MQWLIVAAVLYYLYTQGGLSGIGGQRPVPDTTIDQRLPGGMVIGLPIPQGWRVWRLADGSQVIIEPGAATAPSGWVQGTHNGEWVWFNENTGELRRG